MAHSSRGLGHLPLKEEITGSNPVCATKVVFTAFFIAKLTRKAVIFWVFANGLLTILLNCLFFTLAVKHPVEKVDYAELDPLIIEAARSFATPLTEFELSNPKVTVHYIDGRRFMSWSRERYDVIIINLPSPSTLQLNRFYTREFFEIADARLSRDGILAITCPGSLSYMGEELANLNACIYRTLYDVFPYVRAVLGEANLFLASPSAEISTAEPALLAQRLQERALETRLLSDFHIQYKLDKVKEDWFLDSIAQAPDVRINRDLPPGYFMIYRCGAPSFRNVSEASSR